MKSLLRACRTLFRDFPEVVSPPGAEWCLGLLLALGGWQVGLNAQYVISDVLMIGGAFTQMLHGEPLTTALPVLLQGFLYAEGPSFGASVATIAVLALLFFTLGGWTMTTLQITSGRDIERHSFWRGITSNWRMMLFYALMGAVLGGGVVLGCSAGLMFLQDSLWGLSSAYAPLGYLILAVTGLFGVVYGATMVMGGFVAIAEPQTSFWALYGKGLKVFRRGHGASTLSGLFLIGLGWECLKWLLSYILLPWPVLGTLMLGLQALGDGIFLLYALLALGYVYARGTKSST